MQTPLLVLIDRDGQAKHALQLLHEFCAGKEGFVCGIVHPSDEEYNTFNSWVEDPQPEKSRLTYMTTDVFQKYLYEGDLTTVSQQNIEQFLQDVKSGEIKSHSPEEMEAEGPPSEHVEYDTPP